MLLRAVLLVVGGVSILVSLTSAKTANPLDYPACPQANDPEYYCCEYSETSKYVYTMYKRPSGGPWADQFEDGWKESRQVNYPYTKYTPDTPHMDYSDPKTICRVKDVVEDTETGELSQYLACTNENDTLFADSQITDIFLTYEANLRNNNASFPVGAICYSLMLDDGTVDDEAQANCTSVTVPTTYQFKTYGESKLLLVYFLYLANFVLIFLWWSFKKNRESKQKSGAESDVFKKLMNERGGPQTPKKSIAGYPDGRRSQVRQSDTELIANNEDIDQTGYKQSMFGTFVLAYFMLATVGLSVLLIIITADYYDAFTPALFDPTGPLVLAFFLVWLCTAVWYSILVTIQADVVNFFRLHVSLYTCDYVHMVHQEEAEIMLVDKSGVSDLVAKVQNWFAPRSRSKGYAETVPVQHIDDMRLVEFQNLRFIFDEGEERFVPGVVALGRTFSDILNESAGLTESEAEKRYNTIGSNTVKVKMPSMGESLVQEFFTLFYIYQVMCYFVWYYFDYWNLGIVMTVVILLSAVINIYTQRQMQGSIVEMTSYITQVTVYRDGTWKALDSPQVVPGDLVSVSENWELPCDMVIIKGSTVCDESMLTGESMPVQKFPIPENSSEIYDDAGAGKKHTLFAGTRVLSSGRNEQIHALVQTTGAHTSKGQLVQSILFPMSMRFKYDEHLKVMIVGLLCYGAVACVLGINFLTSNGNLSNKMTAFCYCVFLISAVVSPLLPVVITVGQVNAAKRLEKVGVFSLNTQRITLCGKVRIFCFDKTGTLTKQGLDFLGVQPVENGAFLPVVTQVAEHSDLSAIMQFACATCHSVGSLDDRYVGNEVEVQMLRATGWELVEEEGEKPYVKGSKDPNTQLEFLKRYDFDHHRMSMSVVVKNRKTNRRYVFCKGSYEKMQQLCLRSTVPSDYKAVADGLARNGCYLLGIAYRELPADWTDERVLDFVHDRDAVDEELSLLGLIMFRNELKPDTADAIKALKEGDTRTVMITGDNAMCGCYIARESGMIDKTACVLLGDVVSSTTSAASLVWRDVDRNMAFHLGQVKEMVARGDDVELAVTGRAFDFLNAMGEMEDLLLNVRIYSRMTPNGKIKCIQMHMETGAVTGMCGDGGNDCGALRMAHTGVALSDAEASVVSPFTSKSKTIRSVVDLCREGRCSVATSFASVKFLIMYGVIASTLRMYQWYHGVIMSEWCFILADGFTMVGLSYVITLSKPLDKLGKQRPTSSLVGPQTLASIVGQEAINVLFLLSSVSMLVSQDWYCPFTPNNVDLSKWWLLSDNAMATCLFFAVISQQQTAAWVFSFGTHYRKPIWTNRPLLLVFACFATLGIYLLLGEPTSVHDLFRIASSTNVVGLPWIPLPLSFRLKYFGMILGNVATVVVYEYVVILGPVRSYFRHKYHKDTIPMRK